MSIDPKDSLTDEERALARQLGRSRREFAPSAGIDDAIRASARAASAPRSAHRALRPQVWLRFGGLAAALVLTVGLAWKTMQLPGGHNGPAFETSAATTPASDTPAPTAATSPSTPESTVDGGVQSPVAMPSGKTHAALPAPPTVATPSIAPAVRSTPDEATSAHTAQTPPDSPAVKTDVAVQAAGAHAPAQEATPRTAQGNAQAKSVPSNVGSAMPSPAAPQVQEAAARHANEAAAASPREAPTTTRPAPPAATDAAAAHDRALPQDTENGYDARPPATTDAQEVQLAWLKRIRALLAEGKREEAATSLQAWRKRYPDAPVPNDLRSLEKTPTP